MSLGYVVLYCSVATRVVVVVRERSACGGADGGGGLGFSSDASAVDADDFISKSPQPMPL